MIATAFCPARPGLHPRTATGRRAGKGSVAVDPRVIPLGSLLYISGYGWGRAADTGGHLRGHRIDVFFPTRQQTRRWGRRPVTVTVFGGRR